jgi:hypothetical protein
VKSRYYILLLLIASCCSKSPEDDITLIWDNDRAVAVRIGSELLPRSPIAERVHVHRYKESDPVLGEINEDGDAFVFTPIVAFTGGLNYEVRYNSQNIGIFKVPVDTTLSNPELLSVYPTGDTVPENLLKMYLTFSEPMMEDGATKHILLVRDGRDTLRDTFLDLQPELWNTDGTILTLWLDPGRVKRDLIPNKTLGQPISRSSTYELVVKPGWRSTQGAHTQTGYWKSFYAGRRDEAIPNPDRWKVKSPPSLSRDTLIVSFDEALDYKLITDAIHVLDSERRLVEGEALPGKDEKSFCFIPVEGWKRGPYLLMIESRLEDLAGNNLTRPFDRDVTIESKYPDEGLAREIVFNIQ